MTMLHILTSISSLAIIAAAVWANLSHSVDDSVPVKITLGLSTIMAYLTIIDPTQEVLAGLVCALGLVILALGYQRFVIRRRLFHRSASREPKHMDTSGRKEAA